jgi:hypothetical protein
MCNPCLKAYQHNRCLTSAKLEKLGPILRSILEAGDEHAKAEILCDECSATCQVGEGVVISGGVLHHAACVDGVER